MKTELDGFIVVTRFVGGTMPLIRTAARSEDAAKRIYLTWHPGERWKDLGGKPVVVPCKVVFDEVQSLPMRGPKSRRALKG